MDSRSICIPFILILCLVEFYFIYRNNKINLGIHKNANYFRPGIIRFIFSWYIYSLWFFIPVSLIILFIGKDSVIEFLIILFILYLLSAFPVYPYYTVIVDENKLIGPSLWSWRWNHIEINSADVNKVKVFSNNIGKIFGISIIYSKDGNKVLTLGLDNSQISQILDINNWPK
jgi:hypothetical protein